MVQRITRPEGESLDDLAGEAAALDAPPGGDDDAGQPGTALAVAQPPLTNGQILGGALTAGRDIFCSFTEFTSPKVTLSDDKIGELVEAWAPVLEKHQIDLAKYMGDYALELAALIITAKIAFNVRNSVLIEMAQREAAAKAKVSSAATENDGAAAD